MRAWIRFSIVLGCIGLLFSQELNFRNYSLEQGLVQTEIDCIMTDSRGFIWMMTLLWKSDV